MQENYRFVEKNEQITNTERSKVFVNYMNTGYLILNSE
jgi:hypothetical protein